MSIHLQLKEYENIAQHLTQTYHQECNAFCREDIYQEAIIGIFLALTDGKKRKFPRSHAYSSAKHRIFEFLRANRPHNQNDWSFKKMQKKSIRKLEAKLLRSPTHKEIADEIGMDIDRYHAYFTRYESRQDNGHEDEVAISLQSTNKTTFEQAYLSMFLDDLSKVCDRATPAYQEGLEAFLNNETLRGKDRGRRFFEREMFKYNACKDLLAKQMMRGIVQAHEKIIETCSDMDLEELMMYLKPLIFSVLPQEMRATFDSDWEHVSRETLLPYLREVAVPYYQENRVEREALELIRKGYGNCKIKNIMYGATNEKINETRAKYGFPEVVNGDVPRNKPYTMQDIHRMIDRGYNHTEIKVILNAKSPEVSLCFKEAREDGRIQ